MVKVLFFASIRDQIGLSQITVDVGGQNISAINLLEKILKYNQLFSADKIDSILKLPNLRCAINQTMSGLTSEVKEGDEVAFFPPVTGG